MTKLALWWLCFQCCSPQLSQCECRQKVFGKKLCGFQKGLWSSVKNANVQTKQFTVCEDYRCWNMLFSKTWHYHTPDIITHLALSHREHYHTPPKVCIHLYLVLIYSETEALSFWWNFHQWLHWKLSFPVQPLMKISSKWRHFCFRVYLLYMTCKIYSLLRYFPCCLQYYVIQNRLYMLFTQCIQSSIILKTMTLLIIFQHIIQ